MTLKTKLIGTRIPVLLYAPLEAYAGDSKNPSKGQLVPKKLNI